MSLSVFSRRPLIVFMTIAPILVSCAGTEQLVKNQPPAVTIPKPAVKTIHKCANTGVIQSDLSQPWSRQNYWCGSISRVHVDKQIKSSVSKAHIAIELSNREKTIRQLKIIKNRLLPYIKPVDVVGGHPTILFAHHSMLLGPKGRRQANLLMDKVSKAKRVLIRGLFESDEIINNTSLGKEKTSVARALSVRKYWETHGIDVSHVTILHHSKNLSGQAVAVTFQ